MPNRTDTEDYRHLFLQNIPMLDVRAPVEYQHGAFPNSINHPLLDNEQRRDIGIEYKKHGQNAAIKLGWKLATNEVLEQRLLHWKGFVEQHNNGYLYCFRGGLRSKLSQQLIADHLDHYPMVIGGYKAMRSYLMKELDLTATQQAIILLSGATGCGKTEVLSQIQRSADLEGLATHRGSAFGSIDKYQPTQINFENSLSIELLKLREQGSSAIFLEDEGKLIGRIHIPLSLRNAMRQAPHVTLISPLEERVDRVLQNYVKENFQALLQRYTIDQAQENFRCYLFGGLKRIRKRLGGIRYQQLERSFGQATTAWFHHGDSEQFKDGITKLLTEYYDPMYEYQQSQCKGKGLFRGNAKEIVEWANQHHQ